MTTSGSHFSRGRHATWRWQWPVFGHAVKWTDTFDAEMVLFWM